MFFSTVWGWIKRWFDPMTVSKIFILSSSEVLPTLRQFIDPENIPKKYGGELEFSWGDLPTVDPAWDGVVQWEGKPGFPTGPHVWRDVEGGRMECVGVGQRDGVLREERICSVERTYRSPVPVVEEEAVKEAVDGEKKEGEVKDETLSAKIEKLDITKDGEGEKAVEVSPAVSPALPTTVA